MKRLQALFVAVVIGSIWASPACKSNEVNQTKNIDNTFSNVVGPEGKTFDGPEGTRIRIPAGAVDEPVEITISEAAAGEYPVTESFGGDGPPGSKVAWAPVGKVWAFEPHGQKFFVETTMWLPAPPGDYEVMKAQPGGTWENGFNTVLQPVDGKVEFTTKSFSFYTLRKFDHGPRADAGPTSPCDACKNACLDRCGKEPACTTSCISSDCAPACEDAGPAKPDGGTGADSTIGCTPMCPPSAAAPGAPCTFCGTSYSCPAKMGPDSLTCQCGSGGMLVSCVPTTPPPDSGSTDTSVSDTGMCGGCPSGSAPLRPGETGTPCCKLFGSEVECTSSGAGPYTNPCTAGSFICRTGSMTCL